MPVDKPPFRADHVGSLLRPQAIHDARAACEKGGISAEQLKALGDEHIRDVIKKQEAVGLKAATDGEFRRAWWHFDFLWGLDGFEKFRAETGIKFQGTESKRDSVRVGGKVGFSGHPMIDHFKFVRDNANVTAKITIPSPSVPHFRPGRKAIPEAIYPDLQDFFDDTGEAYRQTVKAFADTGCKYLQLDETNFTYLCDDEQRQMVIDRGEDPDELPHKYADMVNAAVSGKSDDMTITMHLCRGNFRSTWIGQGGYEPVADVLFNKMNIDGYFMEYDTERAGGFEPLRLVPDNKLVVLGLVTSKFGELESKDDIKRRIDEAAKYVPLERLCLSPQCGFASTEEGNILSEDEQWAKLEFIIDVARDVWGEL
jgi:5-methyltetrahydropteroyltriglutamate--homocysteine methyltransferase